MKTTIDIPEDLLKEVMEATGSKTIKGAVLAALEWYNHRGRQREVIARLGTLKGFHDPGRFAARSGGDGKAA